MRRTTWIVIAVVVLMAALVVVALGRGESSGGPIDNAELRRLAGEGVRVIDVRSAVEYESGHIPGAENVPVDQVASAAAGWDKSAPVALYCATGARSANAAATLQSLGFQTVYDLSGGITRWDGEIEGGAASVAQAEPSASGLPVMYEFYTDW